MEHRTGRPEVHQWITGRTSGLHVLQSKHLILCQNVMMLISAY